MSRLPPGWGDDARREWARLAEEHLQRCDALRRFAARLPEAVDSVVADTGPHLDPTEARTVLAEVALTWTPPGARR